MFNLIAIWIAFSMCISSIFLLCYILDKFTRKETLKLWFAGEISVTVVIFILCLLVR